MSSDLRPYRPLGHWLAGGSVAAGIVWPGCHKSKNAAVGGVGRGHGEGVSAGLKEVLANRQTAPEREARLRQDEAEPAGPSANPVWSSSQVLEGAF